MVLFFAANKNKDNSRVASASSNTLTPKLWTWFHLTRNNIFCSRWDTHFETLDKLWLSCRTPATHFWTRKLFHTCFFSFYNRQREKLPDCNASPAKIHWCQDIQFFPPFRILIDQLKIQVRQSYTRLRCLHMVLTARTPMMRALVMWAR